MRRTEMPRISASGTAGADVPIHALEGPADARGVGEVQRHALDLRSMDDLRADDAEDHRIADLFGKGRRFLGGRASLVLGHGDGRRRSASPRPCPHPDSPLRSQPRSPAPPLGRPAAARTRPPAARATGGCAARRPSPRRPIPAGCSGGCGLAATAGCRPPRRPRP